jgi:hypothetical protein
MKPTPKSPREYSYLIHCDDLSNVTKTFTLKPNADECAAISGRISVNSIDVIEAIAHCEIVDGHLIHVTGNFIVKVNQNCVVTLEPMETMASDEFEGWYIDKQNITPFKKAQMESQSKRDFIEMPMMDDRDDPEPLENKCADIGELFVQFLSLSIDHFAHKEGVTLPSSEIILRSETNKAGQGDTMSERPNPFAALKNWRPKD